MIQFIEVDHTLCTGCRECEVVCSLYHFGECNPEISAIRVLRIERDGLVDSIPIVCQQCNDGPCMKACPNDAISNLKEEGPVTIDLERCTGCGECTNACPAGCIFIDKNRGVAICCDLCKGRPQCVELCHSRSIRLSAAEKFDGNNRVYDLSLIVRKGLSEGP